MNEFGCYEYWYPSSLRLLSLQQPIYLECWDIYCFFSFWQDQVIKWQLLRSSRNVWYVETWSSDWWPAQLGGAGLARCNTPMPSLFIISQLIYTDISSKYRETIIFSDLLSNSKAGEIDNHNLTQLADEYKHPHMNYYPIWIPLFLCSQIRFATPHNTPMQWSSSKQHGGSPQDYANSSPIPADLVVHMSHSSQGIIGDGERSEIQQAMLNSWKL